MIRFAAVWMLFFVFTAGLSADLSGSLSEAGDANYPVPFLQLPAGAKALGLSGTFAALGDDPTAIYYNPATLARVRWSSVSITGTTLSLDRYHTAVAGAFVSSNTRTGVKSVTGLAGAFVLVDGVERHTDNSGTSLGDLDSMSGAFFFARAFEPASRWNWGYSVYGIYDMQDDTTGFGFGAAVGMDKLLPMGFRIAGVIRDIGLMRYSDTYWLRPRISVALSTSLLGANFPLSVQYDYTFGVSDSSTVRIGFEWTVFSLKPKNDDQDAANAYTNFVKNLDGGREPGKSGRSRGVELKLRAGVAGGMLSGGFSFLFRSIEVSYAITMSEFENGNAGHTVSINFNF